MTYNELAELFKRKGGDAQVCFSVISQNQILFGNNDTKKDIIGFKNEEPIKWMKDLQEEPISENFAKALAEEWKGYVDRGAATVDALEDNTQELAFAKGFYRGWNYPKQLPASENLKKAIDESLAKNAEANDALQEGLRNGKKAVLIIGDDMPEYKCIFIPNGFSAKIEGNKVIFTKDKEPASNEVSEMEFKRLDIPELEKAAMNYSKFYACIQAFKAGANWQFEKVEEALLSEVLPCFMHGGEADEVVAKLEEVLNVQKK